jgi:hypothetical protein
MALRSAVQRRPAMTLNNEAVEVSCHCVPSKSVQSLVLGASESRVACLLYRHMRQGPTTRET